MTSAPDPLNPSATHSKLHWEKKLGSSGSDSLERLTQQKDEWGDSCVKKEAFWTGVFTDLSLCVGINGYEVGRLAAVYSLVIVAYVGMTPLLHVRCIYMCISSYSNSYIKGNLALR